MVKAKFFVSKIRNEARTFTFTTTIQCSAKRSRQNNIRQTKEILKMCFNRKERSKTVPICKQHDGLHKKVPKNLQSILPNPK